MPREEGPIDLSESDLEKEIVLTLTVSDSNRRV